MIPVHIDMSLYAHILESSSNSDGPSWLDSILHKSLLSKTQVKDIQVLIWIQIPMWKFVPSSWTIMIDPYYWIVLNAMAFISYFLHQQWSWIV